MQLFWTIDPLKKISGDIFIVPQILLCCWQCKIKEREGLENNITMSQGQVVLKLIHLMLDKRKKNVTIPPPLVFWQKIWGKAFFFSNLFWHVKRPKLFGLIRLRCVQCNVQFLTIKRLSHHLKKCYANVLLNT